jgi:hypothetical protein
MHVRTAGTQPRAQQLRSSVVAIGVAIVALRTQDAALVLSAHETRATSAHNRSRS